MTQEHIPTAADFLALSPCALADVLTRDDVMEFGLRPLWTPMPRVAGPAYPVRCAPGDNLMLHAAIHRAPPGSVIVVEAGDTNFAVAGGNVCAVAQRRGIAAFVVDGVIRDLAETRDLGFPVFARGLSPIPGKKDVLDVLNGPVHCGGVLVSPGDMIVADEEGIVTVPRERLMEVWQTARAKAEKDAATPLDAWEAEHRERINRLLLERGFRDEQDP